MKLLFIKRNEDVETLKSIFIEQYEVKLSKPPTRAAEKIDCPFSMPTGRKERPP